MPGGSAAGPRTTPRVEPSLRNDGSDHRLARPYCPWANGLAERMDRTATDADAEAFRQGAADAVGARVLAFLSAYLPMPVEVLRLIPGPKA